MEDDRIRKEFDVYWVGCNLIINATKGAKIALPFRENIGLYRNIDGDISATIDELMANEANR